ncbi:MarR family winged helix-turn-helix transcriptional regulator [Nocardia colli]|uniref:MarR family winged helix-turn-helix transcriptional regulator n=1 Tax=Nocardia colli TaxID=2545717 RepID=UPI0035D549F1
MNDALAEELRHTIGDLVRAARVADTMSAGEAAILGYLDRDGPHTTAELAHRRNVTHQSVAKTVKELVGAGLVRTEAHPDDGRKHLLYITDTGRVRLRHERTQRATSLDRAIDTTLTPDERQQLWDCVRLLARITAHMNRQ